jgi:hypothetical protein
VVSPYTPAITVLLRAQRTMTPVKRSDVSLTLVAEKRAKQQNLELISGVDKEIADVAAVARSSNVRFIQEQSGSTTVAKTAAALCYDLY